MSLKAVAFDIDGTLYPNGPMYWLSLPLVATNYRLLKALEAVRKDLRVSTDSGESFHRIQARKLAEKLGMTPERAYALVEARIYTNWFKIFKKLKPYEGLVQTFEALRSAGLKLAVMSDFPIRNRLVDLGLTGPWDCAFSSEETGYLKPHPQAFLEIANRLSLSPSEVLYVGNSLRYDVAGAAAAGMPCAHLSPRRSPTSTAVFTFSKYSQLTQFVLEQIKSS